MPCPGVRYLPNSDSSAVSEINLLVQRNATVAAESADAAREMTDQSKLVEDFIFSLKELIRGDNGII